MDELTKLITVSPMGMDFKDRPLTEDTLVPGTLVAHRRRLYITGAGYTTATSRRFLVELYHLGNSKRHGTFKASNMRMVKNKLK